MTGRSGQVALALRKRGEAAGHEVIALGRPELELTEPFSVACALAHAAPDVIVSAAAYTAVDKAECERDLAFSINAGGAGMVARAAQGLGVPLVHISTDYVFDGHLDRPYLEADATGPTSVYGASKLAGERAVLMEQPNATVLRIAWAYSTFGNNFMKTMLRLAAERNEVAVVADQIGNPTNAEDVSDGILKVAANLVMRDDASLRGVFHMTARGEATWASFAQAIFSASSMHGGPSARVRPVVTADYPTAAVRPANSRLDSSLIEKTHGVVLPDWRTSLKSMIVSLRPAAI